MSVLYTQQALLFLLRSCVSHVSSLIRSVKASGTALKTYLYSCLAVKLRQTVHWIIHQLVFLVDAWDSSKHPFTTLSGRNERYRQDLISLLIYVVSHRLLLLLSAMIDDTNTTLTTKDDKVPAVSQRSFFSILSHIRL